MGDDFAVQELVQGTFCSFEGFLRFEIKCRVSRKNNLALIPIIHESYYDHEARLEAPMPEHLFCRLRCRSHNQRFNSRPARSQDRNSQTRQLIETTANVRAPVARPTCSSSWLPIVKQLHSTCKPTETNRNLRAIHRRRPKMQRCCGKVGSLEGTWSEKRSAGSMCSWSPPRWIGGFCAEQ
jgi:hypothetical protein